MAEEVLIEAAFSKSSSGLIRLVFNGVKSVVNDEFDAFFNMSVRLEMAVASQLNDDVMASLPDPIRILVGQLRNGPQGLFISAAALDQVVDALVDQARRGIGLKLALEMMLKLVAGCEAKGEGLALKSQVAQIVNLLGPRLAKLENANAEAKRAANAMLGQPTRSLPSIQSANADAVKPWQLRVIGV